MYTEKACLELTIVVPLSCIPLEQSLSCQVYAEGDCHTFYGYNKGTPGLKAGIQQYTVKLGSCIGAVPAVSGCGVCLLDLLSLPLKS